MEAAPISTAEIEESPPSNAAQARGHLAYMGSQVLKRFFSLVRIWLTSGPPVFNTLAPPHPSSNSQLHSCLWL